ncbi:MAG: GAF domain-containing sensor histidine kinase [Solirubrobacteraceae bacterium]
MTSGMLDGDATAGLEDEPSSAQLARLVRAVQDLSRARSLPDVQRVVGAAARDLASADGATLVLRDGDRVHYAEEDAIGPLWKGRRFAIDECISGWSMKHGSPVVIEDVRLDERIPQDAYRPTFVRSLVMVPIRPDDPLGAIGTYWAESHRSSPAVVEVAQALADSTAIAMEHVQLLTDLEAQVAARTKDLSRRMAQLVLCARKRRLLAAEAMHAEERERTLLSELIHDDALQYILAARQELAEAAKGDLGALERARPSLDAAHQSLRTLASDLSPVTLQSSSLDELVGAVVSTYTEGRDWTLVTQLGEGIQPVHGQFLPRAARELLTNVAKHAQARKVVVTLEEVDDTVELCVRDDGVGFDPDDLSDVLRAGHIGLASLQSRAEALGGTLVVQSSQGGTRIIVRVPAAPPAAHP